MSGFGQGLDRRHLVSYRSSSWRNDRWTDSQGIATPGAAEGRCGNRSCGNREKTESRLAYRSDDRAYEQRILDTVVTICAAAVLAILLVAGRRD